MSRCCSGKTCACKMAVGVDSSGNPSLAVVGTGTQQDPFELTFAGLRVTDTTVVDLTLSFDPVLGYTLSATLAASSKLDDLGDVAAPAPANGSVLSWNSGTGKWAPAPPTVAPAGAVTHDSTLGGDGSVGSPLGVLLSALDHLQAAVDGLALSDDVVNQLVRRFADGADQAAAAPAPEVNTFSVRDDDAGRLQFWDGADWTDLALFTRQDASLGDTLLEVSGPDAPTNRYVALTDTISGTTDANGLLVLLSAADLLAMGAAGVKTAQWTAISQVQNGVPTTEHVMVLDFADDTQLAGYCWALDGTGPLIAQAVAGTLSAVLYTA